MFSLETAKERLLAPIPLLPAERVLLLDAAGRFAVEPAFSRLDLPRFDNSAMDGYAVRSEDLRAATESSPVLLRLLGRVGAGDVFSGTLSPGECVRIFTGSTLPADADAVVMQEDVTVQNESIRFIEPVKPLENVRLRGEDIRSGAEIIRAGDGINPTRSSLLAATGHAEILVRRQPRVALLATGSELVEPEQPLPLGTIYESNRTLLAALLREIHCLPNIFPLVPDDLDATTAVLNSAFAENDFVITTGGVSVGEFDFVKEAFLRLGGAIEFWKIAVRPGKPFVFGTLQQKHLFGLPGNPVSAFVTYLLLVRPALLKSLGAGTTDLPQIPGELEESLSNPGDRRHFLRARWRHGKVRVSGPQSSHMIGSLGDANCLLDLPPQSRIDAGSTVTVQMWQLPSA